MELIVLGLGSNRVLHTLEGKSLMPAQVLEAAVAELDTLLRRMKVSSVYLTKPMYYSGGQDNFYNMVIAGEYGGSPRELLDCARRIEAKFGRNRGEEERNGPRTLDIDIELFGMRRVEESDLCIPHPRMQERQFVLVPLLEILPESAEPLKGEKYRDIASRLPDQEVVRLTGGKHGTIEIKSPE